MPGGAVKFGAERQFSARAELPRKVTPPPNMRIAAIAARALGGCVDMIGPPRFRGTVSDEFDYKIKMGCIRLGAEPLGPTSATVPGLGE